MKYAQNCLSNLSVLLSKSLQNLIKNVHEIQIAEVVHG